MLPKQAVPEGSRMVLNGQEVWITHIFTTELGNVYETTTGEFIFPNGKPVNNRDFLEALPEQHKDRALAWFEQEILGVAQKEAVQETPAAGRKMTKAELLAKGRFMIEQAEMMEDEEEQEDESTETIPEGPGPHVGAEPVSGKAATKDTGVKRSPKTKETNVLSQMGIRT